MCDSVRLLYFTLLSEGGKADEERGICKSPAIIAQSVELLFNSGARDHLIT